MLGMGYIGTMRAYLTLDNSQYRAGLVQAAGMTKTFTDESARRVAESMADMQKYHARLGMGATILATMVAPMTYAIRRSEKTFGDYQVVLDKTKVVARLTDTQMREIDANMVNVGKKLGVKPTEMMKAGYIAAQSMFNEVKDIQKIAEKSAELSMASGWETTPESAAENLTRMLSAFGLPTTRLQEVNDLLLRTRDVGRFTMEELGTSAGKAASVMAAAFPKDKFKTMRDMMILLASGTLGGVPHNMMATGLRSLMNAIYRESGRPKSMLNRLAKEKGFDSAGSMAGALGPIGFLQAMSDATGGYLEFVKKLGFGSREIQAVAVLIRNAMKNTRDAEKMLQNARGSTEKGLAQHMNSWEGLKRRITSAREAMSLAFAKVLLPYLMIGARMIIKLFNVLERTPSFVKHFIVWAGILLTIKSSLMIISGLLGILSLRTGTFGLFGMSLNNGTLPVTNFKLLGAAITKGITSFTTGLSSLNTKVLTSIGLVKKAGAVPFIPWSTSKYQALSDMSGYTFGKGKLLGSSMYLPGTFSPALMKAIETQAITRALTKRGWEYGKYAPGYIQRDLNSVARSMQMPGTVGVISNNLGNLTANRYGSFAASMGFGLGTMGAQLSAPVGAAMRNVSLFGKAVGGLVGPLLTSAAIIGGLFISIKGWWSAVTETLTQDFNNFIEALSQVFPAFEGVKIQGISVGDMFTGLCVVVETVTETLIGFVQVIVGGMASIANVFPTIYNAISAWMNPGNKMRFDPSTGKYSTVMEKNWLGNMVPVKNSRMEAFGDAWKEGMQASGAIANDAVKALFSKEAWDKLTTSKQWNFPTNGSEYGSMWNNGQIPVQSGMSDVDMPNAFKATREYAGAYLYGSAEAWNSRLPYYLSKDNTLALQKQHLDVSVQSRDELRKMSGLLESTQSDTSDGTDVEPAEL